MLDGNADGITDGVGIADEVVIVAAMLFDAAVAAAASDGLVQSTLLSGVNKILHLLYDGVQRQS